MSEKESSIMATIELTAENLDASIENNDILIIDFWSLVIICGLELGY